MRTLLSPDRPKTGFSCRSRRARTAACVAAVLALLAACSDEPTGLDAGADGPPIVVTAAQPRESGRGETMKVTITGSGFQQGDEAVWERDGSADDRVVVEHTEFVSSTQLIVTITVQSDAAIAGYDIAVDRPRKRGIGTEAFYVLHGIGAGLHARFSFTYDGYRSGSFNVDHSFVLDPATVMTPGSWGLTYYDYEWREQVLAAHYLRDDGLVDMMWCEVPGGRVTAPGTRELGCWFTPQYNFETGEFADPEDYTSWTGDGGRPGDGTGRVTFTSVTPDRLAGTFSITMHVVDWPDWFGSPSITISDGAFDLPVVSSYYNREQENGGGGATVGPPSAAMALNDHGVIVGWANNQKGEQRAVRWTVTPGGTVFGPEELGTVAATHANHSANSINGAGVITGQAYNCVGGQCPDISVGFIHDGTVRPLPTPGNVGSYSGRINNHGVVTGGWMPADSTRFRWGLWLNPLDPADRPLELPAYEGFSMHGSSINNHGVITGNASKFTEGAELTQTVPLRWQLQADGTVSDPEPISLKLKNVIANDDSDFAGTVSDGSTDRATLLRGTSYITLESLPQHQHRGSWVAGLNSPLPGQPVQVIGSSWDRAVVWSVDAAGGVAGPTELSLPDGYTMGRVFSINAHGWIVGSVDKGPIWEGVATLWLPQAGDPGYEIILLGGLGQPAASYRASGARDAVSPGPPRCLARPGRPDRCR
jgi:hypothetical protein